MADDNWRYQLIVKFTDDHCKTADQALKLKGDLEKLPEVGFTEITREYVPRTRPHPNKP